MNDVNLTKYLSRVARVFDIENLVKHDISDEDVIRYYTEINSRHKLLHSMQGSIHMSLNFNGKFSKDGYYEQARIIQKHIFTSQPKRVLELASGKGFNSEYLSKQNPLVQFIGVDITPVHVRFANDRRRDLHNLHFEIGNFQDLSFSTGIFDLIFVVESICHASSMVQTLSEAYRVLKPHGLLIVIDGFRKAQFNQLSQDVQKAAKLVEIAMSVGQTFILDEWLVLAQKIGFTVQKVEDFTEAIIPILMRLQILSKVYFRFTGLSNLLLRVLPPYLARESIAGLLLPLTVRTGAHGYYVVTLRHE